MVSVLCEAHTWLPDASWLCGDPGGLPESDRPSISCEVSFGWKSSHKRMLRASLFSQALTP